MRTFVFVVVTLSILVLGARASFAESETPCTLLKPVKLLVAGNWVTLTPGTAVLLKKRGPQWTTVESPAGIGRASNDIVLSACPATLGDALREPPIEPLSTPKGKSPPPPPTPTP